MSPLLFEQAIDSGYTFIPVDRYAPRSRAIFYVSS